MNAGFARFVRGLWGISCLAASCTLAPHAFAQVAPWEEARYFDVVVGASLRNESNLFKSPIRQVSDTVGTGYIGLKVDRSYAQQQLQLDITQNTVKYDQNSQLDFRGLSYNGAWLWKLGSRLDGALRADRAENQVPFEDSLGNNQRNIRITEKYAFSADWWATGGWHLIGTIAKEDQTSDQSVRIQPDFQSNSFDAGIKYLFPSGNSLSAVRRSIKGDYVNQAGVVASNSDYTEDQSEFSISWRPSGKSSLTGRLAWLERDNSDLAFRDFSGPLTDITYGWTPTGRLRINLSGSRRTGPLQDASFSYTETQTFSLGATWELTPKTSLNLTMAQSDLRYKGSGPVPPIGPARSDTTNITQLELIWIPLSKVTVRASLQYQDRSSNIPLQDFDATIATINGSLRF